MLNRLKADYFLQYLTEGGDQTADEYMREYAAVEEDVSTEEGWRRLRAHYFANINLVDGMVGKITSAIDDAGLTDDTVVVFTSEHGDMLGDHGMLEKRSMYEESSRVPLLVRIPWLTREQATIAESVGHIDLVPTLLDLLGENIPEHLQGNSLVPALEGDAPLENNDVFIEWNGTHPTMPDRHLGTDEIDRMVTLPWRTVVSGRWKLNLCADDQCELFDLDNDPHEMHNLFDDPAQRDRVSDLAARIRAWQAETGDNAPLPVF
jgi:arylsulfatase A-like enzyme